MAALNKQIIPKNIKAIFFDLYGTLLIYGNMTAAWNDWFESVYNSFQKYGLTFTKNEFAKKCDGFFEKEEPPAGNDGLTVFERRIKRLGLETNLNIDTSEIKITVTAAVLAWHKQITVDPEACTTLSKLKQTRRLGLISNFDHPPHIYSLLIENKLIDFFEIITISGEIGCKKPDTRIFEHTLNQTSLPAEQVIYVGDTDDDVTGARQSGMIPVLIQRGRLNSNDDTQGFRADNSQPRNNKQEPIDSKKVITISRLSELLAL